MNTKVMSEMVVNGVVRMEKGEVGSCEVLAARLGAMKRRVPAASSLGGRVSASFDWEDCPPTVVLASFRSSLLSKVPLTRLYSSWLASK